MTTKIIEKTRHNEIRFFKRDKAEFGFLSNFHAACFDLNGESWPTVEHCYMSAKCRRREYIDCIRDAETPFKAKRLGDNTLRSKQSLFRQGFKLRPDWHEIKLEVMYRAVFAKFEQNPDLRELLKSTLRTILLEDSPKDFYWGIGHDETGENCLGRTIMAVRSSLC